MSGQQDDVEKGSDGVVGRWLKEIELSEKVEKDWTDQAKSALKVYGGDQWKDEEHTKKKETFNILWANCETKRPALYANLPKPDIRRRFRDKSPIGKECAELMERAVTFSIEREFDEVCIAAVNDMLLPGRAVTRVKYEPTFEQGDADEVAEGQDTGDDLAEEQTEEPAETLAYQEVCWEQVQWDDFRRGPGRVWKEVPWIAFKHKMTKRQFKERWPDFEKQVTFTAANDEKADKTDDTVFSQVDVWEVWDKSKREVIFFAPSYKDKALETADDPLELAEFFPVPRPLHAIENTGSLIPITEYSMYETLARELESITNRINRIIDGLRLRGIYDSTISEIEQLFNEADNGFVAAENLSRLIEAGGLEKAIWMLPIKEMAEVLVHLYARRESLIQEIYQITGISDIQRGSTDATETLGAQQLKANFGSQRLQRQQREVQRYIKDLIRLGVEVIAQNFSPEVLTIMTGLEYPTAEQKQGAQMAMQMAQQTGQPPDPQMAMAMQKPSWDEIMKVLKSDLLREFQIDIETDSTIRADDASEQEAIATMLKGVVEFTTGIAPAVQAGVMTMEAAKQILLTTVRKFRLGRQVEDALEEVGQAPQQGPSPEAQAEQAKAQADAQKAQMQAQMDDQAHQRKMAEIDRQDKSVQQKHQIDQQSAVESAKLKLEAERLRADLDAKAAQAQAQRAEEIAQREHMRKMQEMELQLELAKQELKRKIAEAELAEQEYERKCEMMDKQQDHAEKEHERKSADMVYSAGKVVPMGKKNASARS